MNVAGMPHSYAGTRRRLKHAVKPRLAGLILAAALPRATAAAPQPNAGFQNCEGCCLAHFA